MRDRIIHFTKLRVPALILSLLIILGGLAGTMFYGGFNLGIDFRSGITMRIQVAESVLKLSYKGNNKVVLNIRDNSIHLTIIENNGLSREEKTFALADYQSIFDLVTELSAIKGLKVEVIGNAQLPASSIIGLNYAADLAENDVILNCANINQDKFIDIADVRNALTELGSVKIQTVGKALNQEFIIGMQNSNNSDDFNVKASSAIVDVLGKKFGAANIVVKQTDYVGPQFSESLGGQALLLTSLTLLLILIYIWFRFKLAYGISAIVGLTHNALVMIGIIGFFQFEVNTATIAAILTVIGYSLNDNIVIFDRIRENQMLLREKDFVRIVNISITQSLGRTIITSFSTILAVIAIYIFASGVIRIFALNLIIGIIVGTYSSMYIASPVLIILVNMEKRRSRIGSDLEKKSGDKPALEKTDEAKQLPSETPEAGEKEAKPQAQQSSQSPQSSQTEQKGVRWQPKRKGRR